MMMPTAVGVGRLDVLLMDELEQWTVTIDCKRLDDFHVTFDTRKQAEAFIESMKEAFSWHNRFKLWLTDENEGGSDLVWG